MDGVGPTYEALRGRSFAALRRRIEMVRRLAPFGINFVVNARTLPDLSPATALAAAEGASEFLLLPERASRDRGGIDERTRDALRLWVSAYSGTIPLAVSESDAVGMPICNPLPAESGLRTYAHIDAEGVLKRSSYDVDGIVIGVDGVMAALSMLEEEGIGVLQ